MPICFASQFILGLDLASQSYPELRPQFCSFYTVYITLLYSLCEHGYAHVYHASVDRGRKSEEGSGQLQTAAAQKKELSELFKMNVQQENLLQENADASSEENNSGMYRPE